MITGIILAAGGARRMGQTKQLLPLGQKSMVWHVANASCQSRLDKVILVTGASADDVAAAVHDFTISIVHNPHWADGQSSSIITGLGAVKPDTDAVIFLLADQPLLTTGVINAMIDAYHISGKSIICPAHKGRRGNPVLFDWEKWKSALYNLSGDQGARKIIEANSNCVGHIPVDSAELFFDVDTDDDYRRMRCLFQSVHLL